MRRRSSVFDLAVGVAAVLTSSSVRAAPPEAEAQTDPPVAASDEDQRKAAAKAEVQAAGAAFSSGDYQAAIDHYAAAMELLPAPKLHYNIGVCHQRLALTTESAQDRTRERDLAIESYNRYLEQNPQAEDRLEIAETIRELGGTPVTMPALKPLFEGDEAATIDDDVSDDSDIADDAGPSDATAEEPPAKHAYPAHGRFGVMLAGGFSPDLTAAQAIDAPGLFALDLHAGGFLGRRRRFLLAAETTLFSGVGGRGNGISFYGYSLGLLGQQTWVLGRDAAQLSFGGVAALTGQGLSIRDDVAPPLCSLDRTAQIAGRTGGLLAPRFDLGVLLGQRRRAMIGLLVQPTFAVFGDGPRGDQCSGDDTPWTVLGLRRRWQFQLWAGLGYSFRF